MPLAAPVVDALTITPSTPVADRVVDITTTGRRSGAAHRKEIWLYGASGHAYLTGSPGKRSWYANLLADPSLTVHLKQGIVADVPAVATPITDEAERRAILGEIVADLAVSAPSLGPQDLDAWVAGSPLVRLEFTD